VLLQPGLYILRHPKTGLPPLSISRAAGKAEHNGQIQAIYTPGTDGGVLRNGSDAIVMQVLNAPVELLVTAYLDKAGATVPVVKIDRVQLDGGGESVSPQKSIQVPPKGITLIGHVERKGDLAATPGKVLGDPKGEMRLEGFQVEWPDKPDGVDLTYGARVEGGGATPTVSTGSFCGTRNAAKRLVEVTFSLAGTNAQRHALKGVAHFSGGYEMEISSGMPLSGPSGMEHLTAIALEVVPANAERSNKGAWEASPRTRIFKGGKSAPKSR
jgi:hypothetical protein